MQQIKNLYIYIWVYVKYIFSTYIWKHIHSIVSSDSLISMKKSPAGIKYFNLMSQIGENIV